MFIARYVPAEISCGGVAGGVEGASARRYQKLIKCSAIRRIGHDVAAAVRHRLARGLAVGR